MPITLNFDKKRFTCKFGSYCTGNATDLADPSLHARSQEYRRRMSGEMRALASQDISRIPRSKGYYVTKKYDGEFALCFFDGDTMISVNPGGTVRSGLPAFDEAVKLLKKAKVKECIFAGELYVIDAASQRNAVQQVVGILRSPKTKTELDRIGLAVFNVVELAGKPIESSAEVHDLLKKWFAKGKLVKPVESVVADTDTDILEAFTNWVIGEGAEGIVVRHDRAGWYKVKLRHNIDAAIIGFSEGVDERKGLLHDLLVALIREDGTFHEFARVGGGYSDEDRKTIAAKLKKTIVPSDYVAVNNDYVAYEMVKPGPVIELSCLDLIPQTSKGDPVKRMVLDWDGKRYLPLVRMPLVSVISPQFVRLRDDKEATIEDVNIRQIAELANVSDTEKPAREDESPPSKLIERVVYTKLMKGNTMVRKLLLWKTNKEETGEFPAYVVYLTDFSPNRKTPLERDIRIANDEKSARKLFDEMAEKNFIGGWEKSGK